MFKSDSLQVSHSTFAMGESDDVKEAVAVLEAALPELPSVAVIADEAPAAPVVETPCCEAPVVEAPVIEVPVVEAPTVEVPVVETPIIEAPVAVVEAPVVEVPVIEAPVIEAPCCEVEAPVAVVEAPVVEAPVVEAVEVVAPVVEPVVEAPPIVAAVIEAAAAIEEAVQPVLEAVEPIVDAIVDAIPAPVVETAVEISAPLVEAVTTPEVEDAAPAPLPCLDVFAPCETLGDVAPTPVEVVVVEAPAPVVEVPVVVAPTPVAKEPIPRFADLGSLAGGVLDAPFSLGALSLDFSLGTKSGSNFGGSLSMATRGKALSSVLSSAHTLWGHDLKLRYTSDRVLEKSLSMKNVLLPGLDLALNSEFSPDSGKVNLGLNSTFSNDLATVGVSVTDNLNAVEASAVIHKSGWLAGVLSNVDPKNPANLAASFALGYKAPDFQAMTTLTANKSVSAHIYQKLVSGAESGIEIVAAPGAKPSLALAHKVALGDASTLAVKVDNSSLLSVAFSTALRPGVSLNLCGAVNATNVAAGPNDFGIGLTVEG